MSEMPLSQLPHVGYVYRPETGDGAVDWVGPDVPEEPTAIINCLLSGIEGRDELLQIGLFDAGRFLLFTSPTADIKENDEIEIENVRYKVMGPVVLWRDPTDGFTPHHKECIIIQKH